MNRVARISMSRLFMRAMKRDERKRLLISVFREA